MIKFFSVVSFILIFSFTAHSQNYSTHQVKESETIEGIAKRYNVTPFDIYGLNPEAKRGLKPNTILIIPISKAVKPTVVVTKELQGFKSHKVARKETLYGISKEHNVTEDEIKKYNNFLYSSVLNKGDKLQIPIFKEVETVTSNERTKLYMVQPKEGKWRVAYKFGISVEELEKSVNRLESMVAFEDMSLLARANNLAFYELLGDANMMNTEMDRYRAVTVDDVKREAKIIFRKENSNTLYYLRAEQ